MSTGAERPAQARLRAALAEMDRAFADIPRLDRVAGCGYCFPDPELEVLGGDPAAAPADLVCRFAESGIDHWSEDQYEVLWRGLAPRIVRLLTDPDAGGRAGLVLRGLGWCAIERWPEDQRTALLDALDATLVVAVTEGRDASAVLDLLDGLAQVHDDPRLPGRIPRSQPDQHRPALPVSHVAHPAGQPAKLGVPAHQGHRLRAHVNYRPSCAPARYITRKSRTG